jgi:hypothetical protein
MPSTILRRAYTFHRKPRTIRVPASANHRAYTRRISGGTVRVKSARVVNRGLPGKGPYTLPPLSPGKLYGYTVSANVPNRYKSLTFAMKSNSPLAVFRRLQILARYLKRTSPTAHNTVLKNAAWVRTKF